MTKMNDFNQQNEQDSYYDDEDPQPVEGYEHYEEDVAEDPLEYDSEEEDPQPNQDSDKVNEEDLKFFKRVRQAHQQEVQQLMKNEQAIIERFRLQGQKQLKLQISYEQESKD